MKIEIMKETDLDRIEELEISCFSNPWTKEQCLYELNENPFSTGYILVNEEGIIGYAFLWVTFELAQLAQIGIDPTFRQNGYGTILMKALIQKAQDANCEYFTLEVRESNKAARKLYESQGFIQVNVSKSYYPDGEDAIVYTMAI